jgi:tetratricopeptide (TPR) repeat protein
VRSIGNKNMTLFRWTLIVLTLCLMFPLWGNSEKILQEAQTSYQQGEKATTYEERKLAFNHALSLYLTLEQEAPSADLDQALGNTYFQIGEYAWAILYYQRALKQDPQNSLLFSHLKEAQKKLGLSEEQYPYQKKGIKPFFILSQQFQLLFWVIFFTIVLFSCTIWLSFPWIRKVAMGSAALLALLLANFLFFYYFTPLEGILVKTAGLYRAPDWNQPQLTNEPLLAGSKVQVLQTTSDGNWLKIENPQGTIGYLPTLTLRLI